MSFSSDADTFLADFGVLVTWTAGGVSAKGVLDTPDQIVGDGMAISTEFVLTVKAAPFAAIDGGDQLVVNGTTYRVKEFRKVDDGTFARITLAELA